LTDVVLFHHAQGLTPGVQRFADDLGRAGHQVNVPDLFEGKTFATREAGMAYVEDIGFGAILERGRLAVDGMAQGLVYVGFSLGVLPAQMLAQTRPGAKGALFAHACIPISQFGGRWPSGLPVQVHAMEADPYFVDEGDLEAAQALVESTDGAELFLYAGHEHLFADESLPSYDAAAATLLRDRALAFLSICSEER